MYCSFTTNLVPRDQHQDHKPLANPDFLCLISLSFILSLFYQAIKFEEHLGLARWWVMGTRSNISLQTSNIHSLYMYNFT